MAIKHSRPYDLARRDAYPDVGDQLDAVAKLALALREQGIELPQETSTWLDQCLAVKAKFKKPVTP